MFGIGKIFKGLNLPGGLGQALMGDGSVKDQRAAFTAVLVATAAHVSQKPNFNLELEINDLWVRLGNLRQEQPKGIAAMVNNALDPGVFQGLNKALEGLLKNLK
jgi:hypothetical protein